jgi:hypothetical protein
MLDQLVNSHSLLLVLPAEILLLILIVSSTHSNRKLDWNLLNAATTTTLRLFQHSTLSNAHVAACDPSRKKFLTQSVCGNSISLLQLLQKVIVSDERPRSLRYLEMLIHFQDQGTIIHGGHERSLSKN